MGQSTSGSSTGELDTGSATTAPQPTTSTAGTAGVGSGDTTATTGGSDDSGSTGEDDSSSSTGARVDPCSCPDGSWVCESFEEGFDPPPDPWGANAGGGADDPTTVESDDAPCGSAYLDAVSDVGTTYSVAVAFLDGGTIDSGLVRLHVTLRIDAGCFPLSGADVRAIEFQLNDGQPRFFAALALHEGGGTLRLQNMAGGTESVPFTDDNVQSNTWIDVIVDLDFVESPPEASVYLDGDAVESGSGNLELAAPVETLPASITLGPYLDGAPFDDDCGIAFDDVWLAPRAA